MTHLRDRKYMRQIAGSHLLSKGLLQEKVTAETAIYPPILLCTENTCADQGYVAFRNIPWYCRKLRAVHVTHEISADCDIHLFLSRRGLPCGRIVCREETEVWILCDSKRSTLIPSSQNGKLHLSETSCLVAASLRQKHTTSARSIGAARGRELGIRMRALRV